MRQEWKRVYVSYAHMQKLAEMGYPIRPLELYYESKVGDTFDVKELDLTSTRNILGGWDQAHKDVLDSRRGEVLTLCKPSNDFGMGWFALVD